MEFLEKHHLEPRLFVAVFLDSEQAQSPEALDGILQALDGISKDWRVLIVARPPDEKSRNRLAEALTRSLLWVEHIPEGSVDNCMALAALVVTDCSQRARSAAELGVRCLYLGHHPIEPLVELGWVIQHSPGNPHLLLQSFDDVIRVRARTHAFKETR